MKPARLFPITVSLLLIPFLLASCSSPEIPTPTKKPAPIRTPTEPPPPLTAEPTKIPPSPTPTSFATLFQLTYLSFTSFMGPSSLYAYNVICSDLESQCFEGPHLLFRWDSQLRDMDWSPDGTHIVFTSGGDLFIADYDGNNVEQLTDTPASEVFPQWSPDGSKIAFLRGSESGPTMFGIYNLETGLIETLFDSVPNPDRIQWLNEENMVYVSTVSQKDWNEIISIVATDGSIIHQFPENYSSFSGIMGIDTSTNGRQIVFVGEIKQLTGTKTCDLFLYDLDNYQMTRITDGLGKNLFPAWSPKYEWVAFESDRDGDYGIYLIKPDGTGLIQVTDSPGDEVQPSWRNIQVP